MARVNNLTNFLTDVASAIKEKTGDSSSIPASQFDSKILAIPAQGSYQTKSISISSNGTMTLLPDTNYDAMDRVLIVVDVPVGPGDVDLSDATISPDKVQIGEIGYGKNGRMVGTLPTTNSISNGSSDSHTQANLTQYSTLLEDGIKAEFDVNSKSIVLANSKATMYISASQIANLIGLTADKIKAGTVVLGVSGTYTGEGGSAPDYTGTIPPNDYDTAVKTCLIILGELKEE